MKQCANPQIGNQTLTAMIGLALEHIVDHIKDAIPQVRRHEIILPSANTEAQRERIVDLYQDGIISKEEMLRRLSVLEVPQQEIVRPMLRVPNVDNWREKWEYMTDEQRRRITMQLIERMRFEGGKPHTLEIDSPFVSYPLIVRGRPKSKVWLE